VGSIPCVPTTVEMSACGTKPKWRRVGITSAFGCIADEKCSLRAFQLLTRSGPWGHRLSGGTAGRDVLFLGLLKAGVAKQVDVGKGRWTMVAKHVGLSAIAAIAVGLSSVIPTFSQSYPDRMIKIIVPYPGGGPTDVMARLIAQRLSASLGQTVIVDNRPGAGGTIGTKVVASAPPDGYTLQLANLGALVIAPALYKNIDYDPIKSFTPVAIAGISSFVLVVTPTVPAKTVPELIAYAKANPGKLNHGAVLSASPHLLGELFKVRSGTDILFVPYKGTAPVMTDLIGGQIQLAFEAKSALLPLIQQGKLRALAVTSETRWPELPDVPTMSETGFADLTSSFWQGVVAPANTSATVVSKLNATINEGVKSSEMQASFAKLGLDAKTGSPEEFGAIIASDVPKWAEIVRMTGAKAE
jgi:tripartite-type tricarboxylate transporter receptor subunit TctC